jgi:hypothetical protein
MKWIKPVVIALFAVMIVVNGYQVYRIAFVRHEADFAGYLAGAQGLRNGTNPYLLTAVPPYNTAVPPYNKAENMRPFIYPLFLAWLWIPMTFLPPIAASFLWYILSVAMMFYSFRLCAELIGVPECERFLMYGIIGILFISILQWVFMFGQIEIFVLLLLLLATKYLVKNENFGTTRKASAGYFLGAAISAKLMPIVILPMLMKHGAKAIGITLFTIFVLCFVIPFLFAGTAIFHYYAYWFHDTVAHEMVTGDESAHSFTLAGAIGQMLGMVRPPLILKIFSGLFLIAFPLILLFKGRTVPALFASFMLMPLTSTRSEPHHLIMLMPAVMLIADTLLRRKIILGQKEITLSPLQIFLGWILFVLVQLMILWGYSLNVPLDTAGIMMWFGLVFWIGMKSQPVISPDVQLVYS